MIFIKKIEYLCNFNKSANNNPSHLLGFSKSKKTSIKINIFRITNKHFYCCYSLQKLNAKACLKREGRHT